MNTALLKKFIWVWMCLMLVVAGVTTTCHAQRSPTIHYTMEDGLPSNTVYDVIRDKNGFLWFSTDKGLVRYNGISFETFTMADGLPDDEIFHCREDYDGRMWLSPYNGKLCFYRNGKFYTEKNCSYLKMPYSLFTYIGNAIQQDSSIIMTGGVNNFINIKGDRSIAISLRKIPLADRRSLQQVRKINDNRYVLWLNSKKIVVDTTGTIIQTMPYTGNRTYYSYYGTYKWYLVDNNLNLYTNNEKYLTRYLASNYKGSDPYLLLKNIRKIYDQGGKYYFLTNRGVATSDGDTLLKGESTAGMCSDNNDDFWITTLDNGVYNIKNPDGRSDVYKNVYTRPLIQAQYINGKLYYIDARDQLAVFSHNNVHEDDMTVLKRKKPSFSKWTSFYVLDKDKMLFIDESVYSVSNIVLWDHGRLFINAKKNRPFGSKGLAKVGQYIYGFTSRHIYNIAIDSLRFENYILRPLWAGSVNDNTRIMCAAADEYNQCFRFCTIDGSYSIKGGQISRESGIKPFRKFFCKDKYLIGYDVNHTISVYKTEADGKMKFMKSFQEKNVIWEKFYSITDHKLIVSTNNYYRVINFLPDDSIQIRPLEDPFIPRNAEYVYGDSTHCYFLKDGAIISTPLAGLDVQNEVPKVFFTGLSTAASSYTIQPAISINSKEATNINLGFTGVSFSSKEITYQYSISDDKGKDKWRLITSNAINLSSPGYGTYYIKLRAKGMSTGYSQPAMLMLTVLRPFWFSWWFLSIAALAGLFVLFMVTRSIVIMVLKRRKMIYDLESRYHSAEYKTLNALMNPHFIFNSLNNIKGLMNRDDKKTANKFLTSFSNVVRQNMQNLSKETVSLNEEIELVSKYLELEKLRFGDIINYEVKIAPEIDIEEIFIPPLLIQPLAENAIKHGLLPKKSPDGLISVNVYEKDGAVFIEVKDNGVGLNKSNYSEHPGYESLGLSNIEKRLSYLRQSGKQQIFFSIRPGENAGTIALIEIR